MKLLVVRHAIAEDREAFARGGDGDRQRPLSGKGRRRFRLGAAALAAREPDIDLLVSSPLVRARQTADLLDEALRTEGIEIRRAESDALVPGAHPRALGDWLGDWSSQHRKEAGGAELETLAVVGHEPHLSHLVSWLAGGVEHSWIRLKKGGAVLLEVPAGTRERAGDALSAGSATLLWALAPRQLRELALVRDSQGHKPAGRNRP